MIAMSYTQLPDGNWKKNPTNTEHEPMPVRAWYMRDNHTFRALPLDVEAALAVMREERDAGNTYGMLCGKPEGGVVPGPIHARTVAEWPAFEAAARPWLETAVARSKPPNVNYQTPPSDNTPHVR
jgi:hypothetical protein